MRYFKRLSCRPVNVIASALIAFTTGCESIRAIIDYETACGNGPNAEEAVVRLTDEADLRRVIVNGQNEKARIAAMKKSTDEQLFKLFVCSAEASPDMRLMAFQRLVELGAADRLVAEDSDFADVVLTGRVSDRVRARYEGSTSTRRAMSSDDIPPPGFPVAYRLKVIAAETGRSSRESLTTVVLDDAAPIEVRLAAIRKVELSRDAFMKLLKRAGDDGNPMRTEYDQLIKAYLDAGNAGSMNVANAVCGKYGMRSVPLSVRERLFSWLKDEESIQQILSDIAWDIQDALTKAPELEDVKFAKYLFMHAKQESLAKFVQRHKHNSQIEAFLVEAVNNISDDTLLEKIAESSSIGDVILAAARRIKGPSGKFLLDKAEARYESDIQKRVDALLRVYAVDPKGAYSIVCFHDGKIVNAITDKDVLMGLFKLNQDDKGSLADDVARYLKDGIYKVYEQQIVGLSKDRLDEIVALTQNHANLLAKGGKACVIGNYYVGMPLQSFIALNKVQDVKAKALDWKLNAAGKRFVVDGMSFDSRSLFKATGLEKSQVRFDLPRKLGIAAFEIEMTEVKHNRNYFAEAMGSYDFNTVSGGDIYYQSENQAKGVVITVWEKSGRLVMYALGND